MSIVEHDALWVAYWTARAAIHRSNHNTERLMQCEKLRALALRCEKTGT